MEDEQPSIQCRICFDGPEVEHELGRLIRPCLCKGTISHVHLKCLQTWRKSATTRNAFFTCPQCRYRYRFARTWIAGLATNSVVVGGISGLIFTMIVMIASFITTYVMSAFEEPSQHAYSLFYYVSPFDVAQDLVTAAFRVLREGNADILEDNTFSSRTRSHRSSIPTTQSNSGIIKWLIRRFIIGLPLVGAGSLVHMLLSVQFLLPVQWIARYRANRNRRNNSQDVAALIIVGLLILGAARALYKVYQLTQSVTKRLLLRAEDAILEVS